MRAVRLHQLEGPGALAVEEVAIPAPLEGEALVRVHAAAITRDELDWPEDRLPAIPSYELSGVVEAIGDGVDHVSVGDSVFALTSFDSDGVAADYAAVPADLLAVKPRTLDHVESAALPLPALSAWQALFTHGNLAEGQRVLILGAGGDVGRLATQFARHAGAHVVGAASASSAGRARDAGAYEVIEPSPDQLEALEPVDLIVDTAGGKPLAMAPTLIREGGTIVTVAEEPPDGVDATFFIVEPDREQLVEIARLADARDLRPSVDSVFPLAAAQAAFERSLSRGKRGKVVLQVSDR
jgi:NADPH:quinone reductase-like Zn-dependent oxidoreductase